MCTLIFAYKIHPAYDFIFLGNRDEYKNRPAQGAHFWESHPHVLAGLDLEKGGSWTGITREGRLAFVTNYRAPALRRAGVLSRGYLVRDYLLTALAPHAYLQSIRSRRTAYNPFNLLVGTLQELWFYSNVENLIRPLKPGIYGLSNALLDTAWFKVTQAKERLTRLLHSSFSVEELFDILADTERPPDADLPRTGIPLETERLLSAMHIDAPEYGTLYKTIILISSRQEVSFYEKHLDNEGRWQLTSYMFPCGSNTR
ncbi:MAG: NRDE family protein [Peptococcaceae bacterium]